MPKTWFEIKNAAAEEAEISIYDVIGGWGITARSFIQNLKAVTAKKITLRIHSPGGSVFEGNAIYNALKRHPATITAHIDGLAASMASVVALAASSVVIAANGYMMIHNPSAGAQGNADEMRKTAALLDKVKESIITAYEDKTKLPREEIAKMMDDETWMTAAEAKDLGFADVVGAEFKAAAEAHFDLSAFSKAPASLRFDSTEAGMTPEQLKAEVERLNAAIQAANKQATDAQATLATATKERDDAKAALVTALKEVTDTKAALTTATKERDDAKAEAAKLAGEAKTASERAAEIAAANGVLPVPKADETKTPAAQDGKALFDQYQALMKSDAKAASAFWAKHEAALMVYAETVK